ncbi:terpenoid synthase [Xylaria telfairii]|nr:terpenoid synthase [Xylaria telfairii]
MRKQADSMDIPYAEPSRAWYAFQVGAHYAYLCYPRHPLDIRIFTGIYTWIAVLVDDEASKDPEQWQHFMSRFYNNGEQPSTIAQAWADMLRLCNRFYSPVAASSIVTSSLKFVNANVLQGLEVPKMTQTMGGEAWAYYLRDMDGLAEAYVWLTFPGLDVSSYMEAIPDMNKYLVFTNDIWSFYKEECAGEKDNYINLRAIYEKKGAHEVFQDVAHEAKDAFNRIRGVLGGNELAARAWHDHAVGYVAMHTSSARYRLDEIGLAENLPIF